ncbi:hypothetical protein HZS_1339 [Henneguya salminicola]|nr:hypothetical protein HZS_1339 [Henneguya salminicola]
MCKEEVSINKITQIITGTHKKPICIKQTQQISIALLRKHGISIKDDQRQPQKKTKKELCSFACTNIYEKFNDSSISYIKLTKQQIQVAIDNIRYNQLKDENNELLIMLKRSEITIHVDGTLRCVPLFLSNA